VWTNTLILSNSALNAANARWGSLLDAFYGTDAGHIPDEGELKRGNGYNPKRGAKVYELAHKFLDDFLPLSNGRKFQDVVAIRVSTSEKPHRLVFKLKDGATAYLNVDSQFVGHTAGAGEEPKSVVLVHNALHVELVIDRNSAMGKTHPAGLSDVVLEAAITAICDCEDSVATVDAEDKSKVYRNWTGLMKATLTEQLSKTQVRRLRADKPYTARDGSPKVLKGRALLFVRNVGIHMYTDAVKYAHNDAPVPEGLLDCMVTSLAAQHDLLSKAKSADLRNSTKGSMYIVKPKMHGPEEVAYTVEVLDRVEKLLGFEPETIKLGIMDEERRTTVNLRECIRAAKRRCIFINTGFLDRTGDEIHTSFAYGPVLPKKEIEGAAWRLAYEDWNVDIGLDVNLPRCGQIGKGMWAAPNAMADMMKKKIAHPRAGATTAWVPSPTAATLHSIHYHMQSVVDAQAQIRQQGPRGKLSDILTPPFLTRKLTQKEIQDELENNAQGILGYVSRWIQLGVGCSTVPDLHDVGLMEDRATLRISSQHIANWLEHGVVSREDVLRTFEKMAQVVDRQNAGSAGYRPMSNSLATDFGFQCALEMCFRGKQEPNGLTERTLTEFRRMAKSSAAPVSRL
jgi:malate synthase